MARIVEAAAEQAVVENVAAADDAAAAAQTAGASVSAVAHSLTRYQHPEHAPHCQRHHNCEALLLLFQELFKFQELGSVSSETVLY